MTKTATKTAKTASRKLAAKAAKAVKAIDGLLAVRDRDTVKPVDAQATVNGSNGTHTDNGPMSKAFAGKGPAKVAKAPAPVPTADGTLVAPPARTVVLATDNAVITAGHKGGQRYNVYGHAVTAVLRAMGQAGFTNSQARDALAGMGVQTGYSTIGCQCGGWQTRGIPAPLSKGQLDALRKLAAKAADDRKGQTATK